MLTRQNLHSARRIVVKVGTNTLTDASGRLDKTYISDLAGQISALKHSGKEIILVTSAAISAGMERLNLSERPSAIPDKQAAAAVGQGILMRLYERLFANYGQVVGQILMTREDPVKRERYTHLRNTFNALLRQGVIPIVNENDAVAVDELKIGDNDTLSAQVSGIVDADLLIILSDIDGLYTANPATDPTARRIFEVARVTADIEAAAGGAGSKHGTGGMFTKIQAAKIVISSGIAMLIAHGRAENALSRLLSGEEIGTLFLSRKDRLSFRKRWIAFGARVKGVLVVDDGCAAALVKGSSLLPAGVARVQGEWLEGATVSVCTLDNREIARGLINYPNTETQKIKGAKSADIERILGHKAFDEIIHRDNLVIMSEGK